MKDDEIRKQLLSLILSAERKQAISLLLNQVTTSGYERTLRDILEPTLRTIGDRWSLDKLSLAQGFVAGKVVEDFIDATEDLVIQQRNTDQNPAEPGSPPRIAVIGNIEDDYHSLGRTMVGSFLRLSGWTVTDLGNDVTAQDFINAALATGASVIGISAMMLTTARNISAVRTLLHEKGLEHRIALAVGGAIFKLRPELAVEVGGDGTAGIAIDAPELFEQLRCKLARNERGSQL